MATAKRTRKSGATLRNLPSARTADGAGLLGAAEGISTRIRELHLPYGTIMDPIFSSAGSDTIVGYTRTGDSAIWTGHYLSAESFRYAVTGNPAALKNVKAALAGIRGLVDITGNETLARVAVPSESPYAERIQQEEGGHGVFPGKLGNVPHFWIGNTSRDQYSGVVFGLGISMEFVDDVDVQGEARTLVCRLIRYLVKHLWTTWMPNGRVGTTFLQRPDQQLAFLQIARQASASEFGRHYKKAALTLPALASIPILYDNLDDHQSYFKFNLNTINMYSLLRHENPNSVARKHYIKAYNKLRGTTETHQNAHFNLIDHAIKGPNPHLDAETVALMHAWLKRPRRDPFVDLRGKVPAAGDDRARDVISVELRPTTDFLWQRSPFLLYGGGAGLVEGPGVDFILPYWMGRYFGVIPKETES